MYQQLCGCSAKEGFIYWKQSLRRPKLCVCWFKQMSSLRTLLKAFFFFFCQSRGWIHHTSSQLETECPMNKLHCFIIDWEKRCRCDNCWQNGTAANWKHSWRSSRCICHFFVPTVKCTIKNSSPWDFDSLVSQSHLSHLVHATAHHLGRRRQFYRLFYQYVVYHYNRYSWC